MKKSAVLSVLILGLVGVIAAVPAFAVSTVLYDNTGPNTFNPNIGGWGIDYGYALTDSFTLSGATVTGVNFGAWISTGDTVTSVDWFITADAFGGTTLASGTANPTNTYLGPLAGWDTYEESFSISSLPLGAGTYWLQLQNAIPTTGNIETGDDVYWDESDGPSSAVFYDASTIPASVYSTAWDDVSGSETFQILGDPETVTPEPSSFLLLGSGLAGLAGLIKRKLRA